MKKILIVVIAGVAAAALIFAYRLMSKERATESEREKPVASESKVSHNATGEPVVTMDEAAEKLMALKTAPLAAMRLEPEVKGYGRVLDPAALSALVADLVATRATAEASQKDAERVKVLAAQYNASDRVWQTADAAAQRDRALTDSARQRLLAAWGGALADRTDLAGLIQSLATGEKALVRIDLLAGDFLKTPPLGARLFALADENHAVEGEFVGAAAAVDAQTQGQGFLFLVDSRQPGFTAGAAVAVSMIPTTSSARPSAGRGISAQSSSSFLAVPGGAKIPSPVATRGARTCATTWRSRSRKPWPAPRNRSP